MNLNDLLVLREKLEKDPDPEEPWKYFLENFAGEEAFVKASQPGKDEKLKDVLYKSIRSIFRNAVDMSLQFWTLPEYYFVHGNGICNQQIIVFFYYQDIGKGIFTLMNPLDPGGAYQIGRFTNLGMSSSRGTTLPPGGGELN